ncbi:MAG TPA: GDSL-type esterase/lipase family protein [Tepidisphaeraceae bacterium]|jgi:beta-glucosidase|nr:GDSL-type esterase/lipase family protein [Tepidisphaeraceae bacterium]
MRISFVVLLLLLATTLVRAQEASSKPTTNPAALADPTIPAPKQAAIFFDKHKAILERGKKPATVLFIGDSITERWTKDGAKVWPHYDQYQAADFGIGGDRTQHVLWRIGNGELDIIKPKVTVLMIGTNNLRYGEPDKIAEAIELIVKQIREKTGSKVLLLGIFPRGADPAKDDVKMFRGKIAKINQRIAKLDDGKEIKYLDISGAFLEKDGSISKAIMKDGLHPTEEGYKRWVDAMQPTLDEMLK